MKKFLKLLALAAIAVAAALACVFAGCNKDSGESGGDGKGDYNFTIVYKGGDKDGQPVNGQTDGSAAGGKVELQICLPDQACFPLDVYPDANGKISLSQSEVNTILFEDNDVTVFIFHVMGVSGHKSDCEVTTEGKGDYTVEVTPN